MFASHISIIVELCISLGLCLLILLYYSRKNMNKIIFLTSFVCWFMNLYLIILIPYDVYYSQSNELPAGTKLPEKKLKSGRISLQACPEMLYFPRRLRRKDGLTQENPSKSSCMACPCRSGCFAGCLCHYGSKAKQSQSRSGPVFCLWIRLSCRDHQ